MICLAILLVCAEGVLVTTAAISGGAEADRVRADGQVRTLQAYVYAAQSHFKKLASKCECG
jgi:hypothetical protein